MTEATLTQLFERIPSAFIPANAVGVDADVQLNLMGEDGGDWVLGIHRQNCTLVAGRTTSPRLIIQIQSCDLLDLFSGRMDVTRAFMTGKLHLGGDVSFAMSLMKLFRRD